MEPERARQNKSFSNYHFASINLGLRIIGFQNFRFPIVQIMPTSIQNQSLWTQGHVTITQPPPTVAQKGQT